MRFVAQLQLETTRAEIEKAIEGLEAAIDAAKAARRGLLLLLAREEMSGDDCGES